MIIAAFVLAQSLAAPSSAPAADPVETALEARSSAFETALDDAVAEIEAGVAGPGTATERRREALARIAALQPIVDDYARDARAAFTKLGEGETAERAVELNQYGDGLVQYLDGLPAELTRSVDQELAVRP